MVIPWSDMVWIVCYCATLQSGLWNFRLGAPKPCQPNSSFKPVVIRKQLCPKEIEQAFTFVWLIYGYYMGNITTYIIDMYCWSRVLLFFLFGGFYRIQLSGSMAQKGAFSDPKGLGLGLPNGLGHALPTQLRFNQVPGPCSVLDVPGMSFIWDLPNEMGPTHW